MAIHWQIPFVSLRTHTQYTVNVYDMTYSGSPVSLKGAADPFVTEEDTDDDPFSPIRTQSGKLRIIDDGFAADGVTPFDWKQFVPSLAAERPVVLTHEENGTTVVDWQGFIQAQDFSGTLYGNPQVRDFPVSCPLAVLKSQQPSTEDPQRHNFAYVIDLMAAAAEALSVQVVGFDNFIIQGNYDAQQWLHKKFEWMNVLKESNDEDEDDIVPQYNLYEILEDVCRFWGWTCRTHGRTLYLTCYDDVTEPKWVSMTRAQLRQMVLGNVAGTNDVDFIPVTLEGDIFASDDNDDFKRRGPSKAVVQADCNEQSTVVKFAPNSVRKELGDTYTWVQGSSSLTGYFTTPTVHEFGQSESSPSRNVMSGTSGTNGGFCRRQIFPTDEQEKATKCDLIIMNGFSSATPFSQITVKTRFNYSGGSISVKGSLYQGAKQFESGEDNSWYAFIRLGIGTSRTAAKWFRLTCDANGNIFHSWTTTPQMVAVGINGNMLNGFTAYNLSGDIDWGKFGSIPVDEGLNGWLFVDFMGCHSYNGGNTEAQVADFEVEFSRDKTYIQNNTTQKRPRTMSDERVSAMDYGSSNANGSGETWNADCIYASDNNMKYGYGLILNPEGTYMEKARYGHDISDPDIHNMLDHPEQHLADRVAAFWQSSKRQITAELRSNTIPLITPQHRVTMDRFIFNPVAISKNWCDDITTITLLQDYSQYSTPSTPSV